MFKLEQNFTKQISQLYARHIGKKSPKNGTYDVKSNTHG